MGVEKMLSQLQKMVLHRRNQPGHIRVDMFEVQLGAALLLQFQVGADYWVTVLADAGVEASGYPPEHVHNKLPGTLKPHGDKLRLDLIIGTHYDADHLNGLVPIIDDSSIEIGEVWLPPVANDAEPHAVNEPLRNSNLLAVQFGLSDGPQRLESYLKAKQAVCEEVGSLEREADQFRQSDLRPARRREVGDVDSSKRNTQVPDVAYFESQLLGANVTLDINDFDHGLDTDFVPTMPDLDDALRPFVRRPSWPFWIDDPFGTWTRRYDSFKGDWKQQPYLAEAHAVSLAHIRQAAARDAINAVSLAAVVEALKRRQLAPVSKMIPDGEPRRFVWRSAEQRFVPGQQLKAEGPELRLLGPSEGLVKKHWNRLPLGEYEARVIAFAVPIEGITCSNELSYVARFGFEGQGVLVTGDAGCVDFKAGRGPYHQKLLDSLLPLHVIQIAHHGGRNAHFYRVLLDAQYAAQQDPSLLLLSHATDDKHRPSEVFGLFIAEVRKDGDDIRLLFTSRPMKCKVKDYLGIIHSVVGTKADVGDVSIEYDGVTWRVLSHAVSV